MKTRKPNNSGLVISTLILLIILFSVALGREVFAERVAPAYAEVDCIHGGYTGWRVRFWKDPQPSLNGARIHPNRSTVSMANTNSTLRTSCAFS